MLKDILYALKHGSTKKAKRASATKTAVGLGIGAAIGTAVGILFAPKKGKETREDISEGAKKAAEVVKKKAIESYDTAKNVVMDMSSSLRKNEKEVEVAGEKQDIQAFEDNLNKDEKEEEQNKNRKK